MSASSALCSPKYCSAALLAILLCTLPFAGAFAPRLFGLVPAALGVLFFLHVRITTGHFPPLNRLYLAVAVGLPALAAFSSLWALNPDAALERALKMAVVLGGGYALAVSLTGADSLPRWFARIFPIGLMAAALVCLSELITHGFLYHALRASTVNIYDISVVNRAVIALTLLLLPALALLKASDHAPRFKKTLAALLLALVAGMMVFTDSQSAQLAVLVMAVFWFAFPYSRPMFWRALIVLVCAGIVCMPWLVQPLYNVLAAKVDTMPWLSSAYAAERLEIWDFVARRALESPLYGFGIEATRHTEHFDTAMLFAERDHALHPHNAVLQIWIEFGALGVVALCGFLATLLWHISKLPYEKARLALSLLMAVLATSCTSYGLWQGWWVGLFTYLAALCMLNNTRIKST